MAIFEFVGFETGSAWEGYDASGTVSVQNSVKHSGDYALRVNPTTSGTGYVRVGWHTVSTGAPNVNWDATDAYTSFYVRIATAPASGSEEFYSLRHDTTNTVSLRINSDRTISVYRGGTTLVATTTQVLSLDIWYRIDLRLRIGSSPYYELRLDGITVLTGSPSFSTSSFDYAILGKQTNRNSQTIDIYIDDFVAATSDYGVNAHYEIVAMQADSDGTYTAWTVGAGGANKWDCIDEVPIASADYLLSTSVLDQAYTAGFESCASAGVTGTIYGVKARAWVANNSASGSCTLKLRLRSNGVNYDTATQINVSTTGGILGVLHLTDPNTGTTWGTTNLDSIEFGAVEKETTDKTKLYSATICVLQVTDDGNMRAATNIGAQVEYVASDDPTRLTNIGAQVEYLPSEDATRLTNIGAQVEYSEESYRRVTNIDFSAEYADDQAFRVSAIGFQIEYIEIKGKPPKPPRPRGNLLDPSIAFIETHFPYRQLRI